MRTADCLAEILAGDVPNSVAQAWGDGVHGVWLTEDVSL
jgi:hypothetical protein